MRFKVFDTLLVSTHHGITVRIDNPVEELFDLAFDQRDFFLQGHAVRFCARHFRVPQIAEHLERQMEEAFRWLEIKQQRLKLAFDLFLADGFAVLGAALGVAKIVGVFGAAPFRPVGGHGMLAASAGDEAAQGEVLMQVGLGRNLGLAVALVLHSLPCRQTDQRLMLGRNQVQTPVRMRYIARINRARKDFHNTLDMDFAAPVFWPEWLGFQKALHLAQQLEAARLEAFKDFGDNRGKRLMAYQQLAMTRDALVAIANRRLKHPVTAHGARAHTVLGLLAILLALVLRDGSEKIFYKD